VGPWEVLAHWTRHHPQDGWTVTCLSHDGAPVTAAKGLVLGAHVAFEEAPRIDVLLHPGGQGTRRLLRDAAQLDWVRGRRAEVRAGVSVDAHRMDESLLADARSRGFDAALQTRLLGRLRELGEQVPRRPRAPLTGAFRAASAILGLGG
jgi:putative intracellular protease/amidase